jgi:putative transposase
VVLDAFSRRILGWAMATHLRTELVLEALNLALGQRGPAAVIHHSDRVASTLRSPSASAAARPACDPRWALSAIASITRCARVSFATLECELLDRRRFKTQIEARMAVFEFIEGWYNPIAIIPPSTIFHRSTTKGFSKQKV